MTLSELVSNYRQEHGLSQRQFAIAAGLSNGYISMLEKGVNPNTSQPITPTLPVLKKLADGMNMTVDEIFSKVDDLPISLMSGESAPLPLDATPIDFSKYHQIPILGRISAGLPLYADEHIEGYTLTELNGGAEYFALRVHGDSMNAIGINDGYLIVVRRQEEVENGEVAVVMVGDDDATVKRFYATNSTVTLMPQSTNPIHGPQIYDLRSTPVKVLGKVIEVKFTL